MVIGLCMDWSPNRNANLSPAVDRRQAAIVKPGDAASIAGSSCYFVADLLKEELALIRKLVFTLIARFRLSQHNLTRDDGADCSLLAIIPRTCCYGFLKPYGRTVLVAESTSPPNALSL